MRPSRKKKYESTRQARLRRRIRWKLKPEEPRISALSNFLGRMRLKTQDEAAAVLGITRQRVQQLERNALWKIRQRLFRTMMNTYCPVKKGLPASRLRP